VAVTKRDDNCSLDCHLDESRDPALCHAGLTWIPACAGMTVYDCSECLVRGTRLVCHGSYHDLEFIDWCTRLCPNIAKNIQFLIDNCECHVLFLGTNKSTHLGAL
jgi:hypothetical protein